LEPESAEYERYVTEVALLAVGVGAAGAAVDAAALL
jgi:hypothetical protein